jgi:hypothetical protein
MKTKMIAKSTGNLQVQKGGEDRKNNVNKGKTSKRCRCQQLNCMTNNCTCYKEGGYCTTECGCFSCQNLPYQQNSQRPQQPSVNDILGGNQSEVMKVEINENIC